MDATVVPHEPAPSTVIRMVSLSSGADLENTACRPRAACGRLRSMNAAIAGLLGAGIGAVAGLLGGLVSAWQQRKNDVARWHQARLDDLRREERRSLIELTNVLAEASQAAVWLT